MSAFQITPKGRATIVTINRPEVRNALDATTRFELALGRDKVVPSADAVLALAEPRVGLAAVGAGCIGGQALLGSNGQ